MGSSDETKLKKELVNERGRNCEVCGLVKPLIIHHKVQVSHGGLHTKKNYQLICESCHEDKRPYEFGNNQGISIKREYTKKTQFFLDAINNQDKVSITYEKPDGTKTRRTITPKEYNLKYNKAYITGYCHLRNEEREFKLSRVKSFRLNK